MAARIPTGLKAFVGSLESGPAVPILLEVWQLRGELRRLARVLLLGGPLLLLVGAWLAEDRRRGFVGAGVAVWVPLPLGSAVAPGWTEDSVADAALQGLWSAFMAPLAGWGLYLGWPGRALRRRRYLAAGGPRVLPGPRSGISSSRASRSSSSSSPGAPVFPG